MKLEFANMKDTHKISVGAIPGCAEPFKDTLVGQTKLYYKCVLFIGRIHLLLKYIVYKNVTMAVYCTYKYNLLSKKSTIYTIPYRLYSRVVPNIFVCVLLYVIFVAQFQSCILREILLLTNPMFFLQAYLLLCARDLQGYLLSDIAMTSETAKEHIKAESSKRSSRNSKKVKGRVSLYHSHSQLLTLHTVSQLQSGRAHVTT